MLRPIHHTFGPHVTTAYALRALLLLLQPWKWWEGSAKHTLREELSRRCSRSSEPTQTALFASGREGLLALFRSFQWEQESEVIIQGYTCSALPNAIHAAGLMAVYVDCDRETLNIDPERLSNAITPRTCAVICQHTFGIVGPVNALRTLCNEHDLLFIEDCAHILPDHNGPEEVGSQGDVLLLSFGRDKAISGVTGGAVVVHGEKFLEEALRLEQEERSAAPLSAWTIARLLLYAPLYLAARPLYGIAHIGKAFLALSRALGLLVPVLTDEEKQGNTSTVLHALPNACADLAIDNFTHIASINDNRRSLTAYYSDEAEKHGWRVPASVRDDLPLQKFPLFIPEAERMRRDLKRRNVHLDDGWTGAVVCPRDTDQGSTDYAPGSCPNAEETVRTILTLPTHPTMTMDQARALVALLATLLP